MDKVKLQINIDKELRKQFQIAVKINDTTATAVLTEYIVNYVNENK